ncbi:MAG: DUF3795 domain-containing protein [Anaerolineae bacterium]|nr:DUF3795 domain-containing protein [Anaerolineae bacterium]
MGEGDCMERRQAAVCGYYCGGCDAYLEDACCGCGYQLGLTRRGECAVFQCCVGQRGLEHCGLCPDFPCQVFLAIAEPLEAARRYKALLRRAEIGTTAWLAEQSKKEK